MLKRESVPYGGPWSLLKSKAGTKETATEKYSKEDRAARERELGAGAGTLQSFEGPIEQSPYYKNLVTLGTESTSREFDNMLSAVRSRGGMAGFDYTQPAQGTAMATLEQERAGELSRVPRESYLEATGPALTASGMRTARGGVYSQDAMENMRISADLENQRRQRRAALWGSMVGAGAKVASSFAGGGASGGGGGGVPSCCWVATELWGFDSPQVAIVREWLTNTSAMQPFAWLYRKIGKSWAASIKRNRSLRFFTRKLFEVFLRRATV